MISHHTILTIQQKAFLKELKRDNYLVSTFYLAGGTTLSAFYLHHRLSDDLDFFATAEEINTQYIFQWLTSKQGILEISKRTHHKKFERNIFFLEYHDKNVLKIEFSKYFTPLFPLHIQDGIKLESKDDILIDKIACIYDRKDPKDYFDLYYLYRDYQTLDRQGLINQYTKKFGNTISLRTLGYMFSQAKNIKTIPHILDRTLNIKTIQDFFDTQAEYCLEE